ncbi:hypothetical protein FIBSPDRAFT_834380, partial [Athelia psychrophila]
MRHALLLICLVLVQGCIAPAASDVATNHTSRIHDATSSPTSFSSTSDVCNNLNNCRSLVSIITSCLATIFACVWATVHPNVPGPKQTWTSRQFESFKIIVVTLLVPEWVLAWGMRQAFQAQYYAPWTITHGFFTNMGGFHYYHDGKPTSPLAYEEVLALVKSRSLFPPTLDELGDKSKGDALSKSIAVFQTLWFVVQCIARRIENRAITNLEIMTLAYTVITVAMYAAWWDKPLSVRCPIRV